MCGAGAPWVVVEFKEEGRPMAAVLTADASSDLNQLLLQDVGVARHVRVVPGPALQCVREEGQQEGQWWRPVSVLTTAWAGVPASPNPWAPLAGCDLGARQGGVNLEGEFEVEAGHGGGAAGGVPAGFVAVALECEEGREAVRQATAGVACNHCVAVVVYKAVGTLGVLADPGVCDGPRRVCVGSARKAWEARPSLLFPGVPSYMVGFVSQPAEAPMTSPPLAFPCHQPMSVVRPLREVVSGCEDVVAACGGGGESVVWGGAMEVVYAAAHTAVGGLVDRWLSGHFRHGDKYAGELGRKVAALRRVVEEGEAKGGARDGLPAVLLAVRDVQQCAQAMLDRVKPLPLWWIPVHVTPMDAYVDVGADSGWLADLRAGKGAGCGVGGGLDVGGGGGVEG